MKRREDAEGYFTSATLARQKATQLVLQKRRAAALKEVARLNYQLDRYSRAVARALTKVLAKP
jgi:hypothetical protein